MGSIRPCPLQAAAEENVHDATPEEKKLIQEVKEAVLKDLQEGDWLAQQIELGIENYIRKIKDAQDAALAEQERQTNEKAKQVHRASLIRDHVRGNPDAEISLIEYSDFECPYCKQFHSTAKQIVEAYPGRVNWVYRHFPLAMHSPGAQQESEAAECANELGGNAVFWGYADAIYARTTSNGTGFPKERLAPLAEELGLDRHLFQKCFESGRYKARISEDMTEGEQIGVTGTPGNILLNNKTGEVQVLIGARPFDAIKEAIAKLLEEKSQHSVGP